MSQPKLHIVTIRFYTILESSVFKNTTLKTETFYLVIISRYKNQDTTDFMSSGDKRYLKNGKKLICLHKNLNPYCESLLIQC